MTPGARCRRRLRHLTLVAACGLLVTGCTAGSSARADHPTPVHTAAADRLTCAPSQGSVSWTTVRTTQALDRVRVDQVTGGTRTATSLVRAEVSRRHTVPPEVPAAWTAALVQSGATVGLTLDAADPVADAGFEVLPAGLHDGTYVAYLGGDEVSARAELRCPDGSSLTVRAGGRGVTTEGLLRCGEHAPSGSYAALVRHYCDATSTSAAAG